MERIDAAGARDHIEMVERILAEVQPRLCSGGEYFVVWGIAAADITVLVHLPISGSSPRRALVDATGSRGSNPLLDLARA